MTNWTTQSRNATSPALAPAALVVLKCTENGPDVTITVWDIGWVPGVNYRQLLDPNGIPYISAEGLKPWAEYVVTDEDGETLQCAVRPKDRKPAGFWTGLGCWADAPSTHRHPGDWRESPYRAWREEKSNGHQD